MSRKNSAVGVLALVAGSALVLGCGDGEQATGTSLNAATGGVVTVGETGGSSAHTGGSSAKTSGGASNTGGSSTNGGSNASGGSGGIAGTSTTNNGGSTAGTSSTAGATNGGASNTGTTSTAGTTAIAGGTATGGASATGGTLATGGSAALSCTASFAAPANGASLGNANDLQGTCSDGIQVNVIVSTSAPSGTAATLSVTTSSGTTTQVAQTTVSGAQAVFTNASLGSTGTVTLTAAIGGTACNATESVTLNCAGAPTCTIATPTISTAHPALNGVPAPNGDRAGATGAPYQVAFQVTTNAEDGQPVVLTVDGTTNYQATASGGTAKFAGVLFSNADGTTDGPHTVSAQCTNRAGVSGSTGAISYPVDTTPPNLTPEKGTGAGAATISALANGDHFAIADDADSATAGLQIKFCGATTSADALDITAPNPNVNNFCASVGGNTPVCSADTTAASGVACVNINCPGNGAFSVNLTLTDKAGNPTTATRNNLTCASVSPSVTFLDPVSDTTPFSDVTKRILATTNTGATRRDINATTPGAQYNVLACTSAPAGSTATLSTGYMGQTLTQAATTTVVADTNSQCANSGGGNLVPFYNVTLPESLTDSSFNLATATELSITVTDLNLATGSATADVWVDSTSPTLTLVSPTGFCGTYFNTSGTGSTSASVNLTFGSSIPVVVSVQGATGTSTFTGNTVTFSQVAVNGVQLEAGSDTVSAVATKPSTNFGTFGGCAVTVGDTPPPTVTWQTPLATSLLTAAGNTNTNAIIDNSATAGWQGTLTACTNIDTTANPGATVQFSATVGGVSSNIGSPVAIDATSMCATLANATVPDGTAVLLTATTSPVAGNPGVASITVPVSSTIPGAPTNLTVAITDRRLTSFTPNWTAPAGTTVTGYKVRVAKTAIATQANFDAARDIPYTGSGTCPSAGCTILVDGCYIENDYYFAVAALDYVGNQGAFVATATATTAHFNQINIPAPIAGERFGYTFDGSSDLNGDGYTDMLVGYSNGIYAYIYFGSPTGLPTAPSVSILGTASTFGQSVAVIGDINKDGHPDIAIGSPREGNGVVYVFLGRATWPANLTSTNADCVISTDSTADTGYATSRLGFRMAAAGDFNGDGVDDFVISAAYYNSTQGQLAIIYGNSAGLPTTISLPSAFGTAATRINGDAAFAGRLGDNVLGIGRFYGASTNPAIVASAPFGPAGGSNGRLYSFVGQNGTPASMDVGAATNTYDGPAGVLYGAAAVTALGNIGNSGQPSIGVSMRTQARGEIRSGTASSGPFGNVQGITTTDANATNAFASMFIGGGFSGTGSIASAIGSSASDLITATTAGSGPRLFIVDGKKISFGADATIQNLADVTLSLPGTWSDFSGNVTMLRDINNDGYADIGVGNTTYTSTLIDGNLLVLY